MKALYLRKYAPFHIVPKMPGPTSFIVQKNFSWGAGRKSHSPCGTNGEMAARVGENFSKSTQQSGISIGGWNSTLPISTQYSLHCDPCPVHPDSCSVDTALLCASRSLYSPAPVCLCACMLEDRAEQAHTAPCGDDGCQVTGRHHGGELSLADMGNQV